VLRLSARIRPRASSCLGLLLLSGALACAPPPRDDCDAQGPLRTLCGLENPEDLAWAPEHGALVVSQMRRDGAGGSLARLTPNGRPRRLWPLEATPGLDAGPSAGDPSCPPPAADAFAPHGLTVGPAGLYVVNHGGRESVEIFALSGAGEELRARWLGCVELPEGTSGNDVAAGARGEIVVSNTSPPGGQRTASLKSLLGWTTGNVLHWSSGDGWRAVPGTAASVPNGVAISPDGEWVYYAESGQGRVVRVRPDGEERQAVFVPGRPDNLAWSESGRLYVASHLSFLDLARCLWSRPCRAPWKVFELDAATLAVREVLAHDGARIGAVSGAQPVGGDLYLSAVFDDRIGVWPAAPEER